MESTTWPRSTRWQTVSVMKGKIPMLAHVALKKGARRDRLQRFCKALHLRLLQNALFNDPLRVAISCPPLTLTSPSASSRRCEGGCGLDASLGRGGRKGIAILSASDAALDERHMAALLATLRENAFTSIRHELVVLRLADNRLGEAAAILLGKSVIEVSERFHIITMVPSADRCGAGVQAARARRLGQRHW